MAEPVATALMGLTDEERRRLDEIAAQLSADSPRLAYALGDKRQGLWRRLLRRIARRP